MAPFAGFSFSVRKQRVRRNVQFTEDNLDRATGLARCFRHHRRVQVVDLPDTLPETANAGMAGCDVCLGTCGRVYQGQRPVSGAAGRVSYDLDHAGIDAPT